MFRKNLLRVSFGLLLLGVLVSSGLLFATPSFASEPTIEEGSTGPAVKAWQTQLNEINSPDCDPYINVGPAVQVDGIFGPKTLAATTSFQSQTHLKVDGIVGPLTHAKMDSLLSQQVC